MNVEIDVNLFIPGKYPSFRLKMGYSNVRAKKTVGLQFQHRIMYGRSICKFYSSKLIYLKWGFTFYHVIFVSYTIHTKLIRSFKKRKNTFFLVAVVEGPKNVFDIRLEIWISLRRKKWPETQSIICPFTV